MANYTRLKNVNLGTFDPSVTDAASDDIQLRATKITEGVRFTANLWNYYGMEVGYGIGSATVNTRYRYQDQNLNNVVVLGEDKIRVTQSAVNMLAYFMPRTRRWRPFATVGINRANFAEPNVPGWTNGSSTNYGFNWGGGIKLSLAKHAIVRLDVRQNFIGSPWTPVYPGTGLNFGGMMHYWEAGVGLSGSF